MQIRHRGEKPRLSMKNVLKIIREYRKKAQLYSEFCKSVCSLIDSTLNGVQYKYYVSWRVKELESLKEKIRRKEEEGKLYRKLSDIDDIAGVRIVFHNRKDRGDMVEKLRKEFGSRMRMEETSKVSGYRSIHAIVGFSPKRLRLAEYSRFKGLKCEIQLTLILDHAWAEVEHDILYKQDPKVSTLYRKEYLALKKRMENVMNEHIRKSSEELEEITSQIRKIKKALARHA
jgi:GTP pyrophosphokinase